MNFHRPGADGGGRVIVHHKHAPELQVMQPGPLLLFLECIDNAYSGGHKLAFGKSRLYFVRRRGVGKAAQIFSQNKEAPTLAVGAWREAALQRAS